MGWRFWRSDEDAEANDWREVDVTNIDRPASTARVLVGHAADRFRFGDDVTHIEPP
jgi:hypothetical protein